MFDCENVKKRKKVKRMAVLATPKKNSYIIKKNDAEKIVKSKITKAKKDSITENAVLFMKNNIVKK